MSVKTIGAGIAAILLLGLTGCAGGSGADAAPTQATLTPQATAPTAATETAEFFPQLTDADLAGVFTGLQFVPDQYADTTELLDSIYPGLTTSDVTCLTPSGAGWDTDPALAAASAEFGTSNDRSMTAVISSSGDAAVASDLVADSVDALERCANGADLFTMQGEAVQTQVEQIDAGLTGTDEAVAFRVSGDVGGSPFSLVGMTARVGGNVIALVGWDPATSESYVPQATQMFVDKL
ncbi:hypothetical protein [Cryobacterium sp.]|jgi:hypothetical protein|uniref:hypothetical protein n=1 Tax=Cryobacterium sp. TaxID=1926290 RepID=UPI00260A3BCD|nr:hypothetical protein [Cryobacterium sp.]MCU1447520.1 hypothetical protein [Cryobacterium sp.]